MMNQPQPDAETSAVFEEIEPDTFQPSSLANGPWPSLQGGSAAGVMAMAAMKRAPKGFSPVSFRADFLKMMPVDVFQVSVSTIREAKTTAVYDMELTLAGTTDVLSRSTLTLMKPKMIDALEPHPEESWGGLRAPWDLPERKAPSPHGGAWLMDALDGRADGDGSFWFRWKAQFMLAQSQDWFARVLGPADWTHGIARPGYPGPAPVRAWPNTDLSVHVDRPLVGEWIGLRPHGRWHRSGCGIGYSDLLDQHGLFGRVAMSVALIA